jgi:hypothetical protein
MDTVNIKRVYTGWNGNSDGPLAGTERFVSQIVSRSQRVLWSNGTWGVRPMRGKTSPSVHGTGRAMDLSYRHMGDGRGIANGRMQALKWVDSLVECATLLGIELIIDYGAKPFGRAWSCDRMKWKRYLKPTVQHGGTGDWMHIELNPRMAHSDEEVQVAFLKAFGARPKPSTV